MPRIHKVNMVSMDSPRVAAGIQLGTAITVSTIDHRHPLYIYPSDSPGSLNVDIMLTGSDNYTLRSKAMMKVEKKEIVDTGTSHHMIGDPHLLNHEGLINECKACPTAHWYIFQVSHIEDYHIGGGGILRNVSTIFKFNLMLVSQIPVFHSLGNKFAMHNCEVCPLAR
ncbi:hypothetical protein H5410_004629 [Solanum commersonii]|uniref:Uncharacterized protein n=1 Tax=Solanum commersonii TaxID=4109 RepID=A0A9J6B870_SOLCO|nr:hypothetical protein H5410_004629 [Solanum commersonii]